MWWSGPKLRTATAEEVSKSSDFELFRGVWMSRLWRMPPFDLPDVSLNGYDHQGQSPWHGWSPFPMSPPVSPTWIAGRCCA
jgi:hypothetical protein